MSKLLIRDRSYGFVTYVHTPAELQDVIDNYIPGRHIVLGDLYQFNGSMRSMLLKFVEENPAIDCYSSVDLPDPVLMSRFNSYSKIPEPQSYKQDKEAFLSTPTHTGARAFLTSSPIQIQLLAPMCSQRINKLLLKDA